MRRFADWSKQPLGSMMNSYPGEETDTKVIWPGLKVFWFSKEKEEEIVRKRGPGEKTVLKSGQEWTLPA